MKLSAFCSMCMGNNVHFSNLTCDFQCLAVLTNSSRQRIEDYLFFRHIYMKISGFRPLLDKKALHKNGDFHNYKT